MNKDCEINMEGAVKVNEKSFTWEETADIVS